ncbi:MAG: universal stress protein [Bacteroidota bacterium]|jgi:nucleotide-binding universal stress UspA family protein
MASLKILIPTDFSVQAEYAFVLAKRLETKIPLEIHFLHVLSVPDSVTMDPMGNIETCGDIDASFVEGQKQIALRKLQELKNEYGSHIVTHLKLGKLTDQIVSFAHDNRFQMIVMGTKGAWGLQEKLSGSETQMIARMSDVPLLSMMCDRRDLEFRNILLVHDYTQPQKEKLEVLNLIAEAFGACIHMLQVISEGANHSAIQSDMDAFARLNHLQNYQTHFIVDKDVEKGVSHFNQLHEMDIVCIGTHGNKGIERIIHSSATEKLVNHLFKPILTFHLR